MSQIDFSILTPEQRLQILKDWIPKDGNEAKFPAFSYEEFIDLDLEDNKNVKQSILLDHRIVLKVWQKLCKSGMDLGLFFALFSFLFEFQ